MAFITGGHSPFAGYLQGVLAADQSKRADRRLKLQEGQYEQAKIRNQIALSSTLYDSLARGDYNTANQLSPYLPNQPKNFREEGDQIKFETMGPNGQYVTKSKNKEELQIWGRGLVPVQVPETNRKIGVSPDVFFKMQQTAQKTKAEAAKAQNDFVLDMFKALLKEGDTQAVTQLYNSIRVRNPQLPPLTKIEPRRDHNYDKIEFADGTVILFDKKSGELLNLDGTPYNPNVGVEQPAPEPEQPGMISRGLDAAGQMIGKGVDVAGQAANWIGNQIASGTGGTPPWQTPRLPQGAARNIAPPIGPTLPQSAGDPIMGGLRRMYGAVAQGPDVGIGPNATLPTTPQVQPQQQQQPPEQRTFPSSAVAEESEQMRPYLKKLKESSPKLYDQLLQRSFEIAAQREDGNMDEAAKEALKEFGLLPETNE
jgi:hypothetical protein